MDICLDSYGSKIHKVGEMFEIITKNEGEYEKMKISPKKVRSLILSNHISITSDTINLAINHNIDIVLLDNYGNPYGRFWHSKLGSSANIRRKQLEISRSILGKEIVKELICEKIMNNIKHLKELEYKRHNKKEFIEMEIEKMISFETKILELDSSTTNFREIIMAYEGNSSRHYYNVLSTLIPNEFKFEGRSKQPAKDEFNALLNYAYGILYNKVEKAIILAGLDPFVGLLHSDRNNRLTFVFDFIEPFRFLATKTVFSLFSKKKINKTYFDKVPNGLTLNKEGKKILIEGINDTFEQRVEFGGKHIKRIDIIQYKARSMANRIVEGEKNVSLGYL